jgi:hypothetical protein
MNDALFRFQTFSDGEVWFNPTVECQILRLPGQDELGDLLTEFRRRQWEWLTDWLCQPAEDGKFINGLAASLLKAPKGSRVKNPEWRALNTQRIVLDNVPPSAWTLLDGIEPLPGSAATTRLVNAPLDLQRRFLLIAMGDDLSTAAPLLRPKYRDVLVHLWLDTAFTESTSPEAFLAEVIARAEYERRPLTDEERRSDFLRSPIIDLFLLWLSQHGIVLFPLRVQPFLGETRGFEERLVGNDQKAAWVAVERAYAGVASKRQERWLKIVRTVFDNLTMATTLRSADDLSVDLFQSIYAVMDERFGERLTDKLHLIYRALRDSLGRRDLPTFKPKRSNAPAMDHRLDWVHHSTSSAPRSIFPKALMGEYVPLDHICAWGDRFSRLLPQIALKNVGNALAAYQHFLLWMLETGTAVPSLAEVERTHINDGRPLTTSRCFRAYLSRADMKAESANAVIQRLAAAFDAIIEEDRLGIANPVVMRFDTFKIAVARGKTPRRPMGRDLMTYLRELNSRDDFALSRGYRPHQRRLLDPGTGRYEDRWFPAYAVLVDLLLQLPLRGFQARFLDSGEGDEFVVVPVENGIDIRRNPLSSAVAGRREGVFYTFEGKGGQAALGIHVNTNKTAVDRASGYEIPWCSTELRANLSMMIRWQVENNPVAKAIPCMERHDFEQAQNQEMIEAVKTTFALFRDPDDPTGWPVNRDKLFDYWSLLLAAAEDELAAQGRQVSLTVEREMTKGPKKKPVVKRLAAYDIHTLRVSGISALIEAGLPPDMVQDVAGHATVVMTLYYNKIKASRLNRALGEALDDLSVNLDGIDGLAEADYERLSEFLLNSRAPEDAAGRQLLTERMGRGDGSVEVTVHGICPGGECATGGEFANQAVGYMAVPRPLACSLCRYRLTGPMFLTGLVLNANRLMHELRRKGVEIAALNEEREALEDQGKAAHGLKARIEALYRETDIIAAEWAAEVQYVHMAEAMFDGFAAAQHQPDLSVPALVTGLDRPALETKLEPQSEFALLQTLAEGAAVWPGFRPSAAIDDHREFLNEVLMASDADPFLLRLRGDVRDKAALLLGRTIAALVPDDRIEALRQGADHLEDYPAIGGFLARLREQAVLLGTIDETKLLAAEAATMET